MLTSRITPKMSDSPAANMAYSPPTSTPCRMTLIQSVMRATSDPEIRGRDGLAGQILGGAGQRNAAFLQAIDTLHRLERLHHVLLDQDERNPGGKDCRQTRIDIAHHDRRQPEADLVAQQKFRIGHQAARDGDHLLLAARQCRAWHGAALAE